MDDETDIAPVVALLKAMGCRERNTSLSRYFILDGFDNEFYLVFDASEDEEEPSSKGKVDILVAHIGSHPHDSESKMRVVTNASKQGIMRFMFAIGVSRFDEQVRKALYASPLRN